MSRPLSIGVDAGGTRTVLLSHAGSAPDRREGPGAQVLRDGAAAAAETVARLVEDALGAAPGLRLGALAVGLAGAGRATEREAVEALLAARLHPERLVVVTDGELALDAAVGAESGAVAVVGTGSVVLARTLDGETLRVGGWGAGPGDDGSGTALGRAALRAILAAHDGGPPTALAEIAAERFGLADADAVRAAGATPLAAFAPLLLAGAEADDWASTSALAREANALAQQAGWLATRAGDTVTPRLALAGGLAGEPVYAAALRAALERHLPGWALAAEPVDPASGALALAERLAQAA